MVYTKWVHRSLGVVIKGDINEVDTYFAIKESGWSKEMQDLVLAGKVEVGMTNTYGLLCPGKTAMKSLNLAPRSSNGLTKNLVLKHSHLYFEDGVLTNVSN